MEGSNVSHVMIGLPETGKTTFLAALWHVIRNHEAVPGALRLERAIHDLFGIEADGLADRRPWLDHGTWPQRRPGAKAPSPRDPLAPAAPYEFLAAHTKRKTSPSPTLRCANTAQ